MHFFGEIKKWLGELTEIALLLIALGVAAEILFGSSVPFLSQIVPNILNIITALGDKGLVGLVALGIIVFLFYRKKAVA
jgi:ABC-type enterochelin transport system permease subunit